MDDRLFYVDHRSGCRMTYGELARDVAQDASVPTIYAFQNGYELFVMLLRAAKQGKTMVLVDEGSARAQAEAELQTYFDLAPSDRPLKLEYCDQESEDSTKNRDGERGRERNNRNVELQSEFREPASGNSSFWFDREKRCRIGLFTSGTTGKPKLVLHTIDSLTRGVRKNVKHQNDTWGLAYHPAHIAGLQVFFQALANHNPLVRLFELSPDQVHQAIEDEGITHLSATPTFYNLLCSTGPFHPHVRNVTSGGELSHQALRERMARSFPNARIQNIYASTEAGSLFVSSGDSFQVPQAYHDRIKVIDGELAIHHSLLAISLQLNRTEEFYRTGDHVQVLDMNPLTVRFTSRQGEWINVGGYKVNPHEVERELLELEEVREALVYGRSNSVTGSLVCCDLVLAPGHVLTAREIHARLISLIPNYMIPRIVRCVESIKSTHTGKKERKS